MARELHHVFLSDCDCAAFALQNALVHTQDLNLNDMKIYGVILSIGALAVLSASCQSPDGTTNNTGSGLLVVAAFGIDNRG